ncbi:hypothetical protein [Streptomyces sp. NPDC053755]|uniref:hypothetical protein n=1 Tax=Streptomyces sp. NPDC053755 TaxID=3155815 RepID=UPI003416FF74
MPLRMTWSVAPIASASGNVDDIEGALEAFDRSVLRILDDFQVVTGVRAAALRGSARIMRERMLSEGRAAVGRGVRWTARVGEVEVTLTPER